MNHLKPSLLAALLLLPAAALAQSNVIQDTTEFAKVLNYSPIPGPQVARQVCTPVAVSEGSAHNPGAAIAGGLVGALVGSRFGGGHGKDAATVAGAIGGAMVKWDRRPPRSNSAPPSTSRDRRPAIRSPTTTKAN